MNEKIKCVPFVVNERPFACWDWRLKEKNIDFLQGIDSEYFKYISETHVVNLSGKNSQKAALSIRIAYHQAMEMFFALIGALIQSPDCVVGWMLSYRNKDLRDIIEKVNNTQKIYTRFNMEPITWFKLSEFMLSFIPKEKRKKWVIKSFSEFWSRLSSDYLDQNNINEYNSAKHGLRTKQGGFNLSIGIEDKPGVSAPAEKMKQMGGSKFGTSFYFREYIFKDNFMNFSPKNQHLNWNPEYLANALYFISMSINNVIGTLLILNGIEPNKCKFLTPENENSIKILKEYKVGTSSINYNVNINEDSYKAITKEQIINSYKKKEESP